MDKSKVNTFILTNKEFFDCKDIPLVCMRMEDANDNKWDYLSLIKLRDPQTALMLSIFGGPLGIDRIYIGDTLLGIIKTITCGGFLVWAFIDMFLIRQAAMRNNFNNLMKYFNS